MAHPADGWLLRRYDAAAGIRVFWRVEVDEDGRPVVYAYELDPATQQYVATGIHRGRLGAIWPFAMDLDLTGIALPEKPEK